jgi:hypothetical protein
MNERLNIGILLNDLFIPSWVIKILEDLQNSDYAKLIFIIINESKSNSHKISNQPKDHTLIKILEKADRLLFNPRFDSLRKKNVTDLFKDVHIIPAKLENEFNSEHSNINPINRIIRNYNPDVILKFGSHFIENDFLSIPRYGIWAYSLDESSSNNEIKQGFLEVVNNIPVTNSYLGIIKEDSQELTVIYDSWESTCPFSISINRNKVFWRAALFMPRILSGLQKYGDSYLDSLKKRFNSNIPINRKNALIPTFLISIIHLLNYFKTAVKFTFKKLFYTDTFNWYLLYDINRDNTSLSTDFINFKKLLSPKGRFWADPFVIAKNGNYYIFVEEFIYKANKAHITVLHLDNTGKFLGSETIIERPYHLSYPFIFNIDSTYYMIPETAGNNSIELYKCVNFPNNWVFVRNIMENISAVDTTLFYYNDKYWLFTSIDQTGNISGSSTELFLFFADDIFSANWKSHPLNPIVSDVRKARPAGKIFIYEGEIYRPSQDCSVRYGKGFNLNHVTKLTETEYDETLITNFETTWDKKLKGTHTYNFDKDFTIIDVYSFRKRLSVNP